MMGVYYYAKNMTTGELLYEHPWSVRWPALTLVIGRRMWPGAAIAVLNDATDLPLAPDEMLRTVTMEDAWVREAEAQRHACPGRGSPDCPCIVCEADRVELTAGFDVEETP